MTPNATQTEGLTWAECIALPEGTEFYSIGLGQNTRFVVRKGVIYVYSDSNPEKVWTPIVSLMLRTDWRIYTPPAQKTVLVTAETWYQRWLSRGPTGCATTEVGMKALFSDIQSNAREVEREANAEKVERLNTGIEHLQRMLRESEEKIARRSSELAEKDAEIAELKEKIDEFHGLSADYQTLLQNAQTLECERDELKAKLESGVPGECHLPEELWKRVEQLTSECVFQCFGHDRWCALSKSECELSSLLYEIKALGNTPTPTLSAEEVAEVNRLARYIKSRLFWDGPEEHDSAKLIRSLNERWNGTGKAGRGEKA